MSFSKCGHNRSILVIFLELNGWVTEQEHWTLIMASWTQWNPASHSRVNTYVTLLINYFRLHQELKVSQCLSFSIRSISGLFQLSLSLLCRTDRALREIVKQKIAQKAYFSYYPHQLLRDYLPMVWVGLLLIPVDEENTKYKHLFFSSIMMWRLIKLKLICAGNVNASFWFWYQINLMVCIRHSDTTS